MNRQGDGAGAPDWWTELYDDDQEDMGHSAGGDTIDDRFDSAARTVAPPAHTSGPPQPVSDVHDEPEGETAPPNEPPPPARSTDGVATEGDTTSGEAPDTQVVVVPHDAVLSDLVPPVGQPKQGDTLVFARSGVSGQLDLDGDAVEIRMKLGFLLAVFRGPLEAEIHKFFDAEFGDA